MATAWNKLKKTKYPGIRQRPDGQYVVQARVPDGKGRTRPRLKTLPAGTTLEGAVVERARMTEGLRREIAVNEGREAPILSDYAKLWLKRKKREGLRKHTLDGYLANLEKHILPFLGDKRVDEIASRDILAWKDAACGRRLKTGKHYAGWSMGSWFQVLRNIISDIVVEYELPRNPCDGIRAPKKPKAPRRERTLNAEQLREFLRLVKLHCPQHHAITLMLVLYGLRWEEASALHWEHIDEEAMELHIVQTQVQRRVYPTKNENNKLLPLVPVVLEAIREHDEMSRVRRNPRKTKGIVFPARNGNYRLPSSVSAGWKVISRAMNLKWNVAPHDLRRSYQNMLRKASVNMIIQQAMMGHSSEAMTEHYSFVDMEEKRQAHQGVVDLLDYKKTKDEEG